MRKSLTILSFIAALAAAPVVAQSTDGEATDTAEESTTAPAENEDGGESLGLAIGTPEGPQVGETYAREAFTDWELRCVKTEDGNDPCQLYQLLKDGTGNSVAEINIFSIPEGQQAVAGATLITPLETLLPPQVRMSIDGGEAKRYPFSFCTQIGCIARLGFTEAELAELKRGASAKVTIVPAAAPDQTVELTMSLSGFTAGFAATQAVPNQ